MLPWLTLGPSSQYELHKPGLHSLFPQFPRPTSSTCLQTNCSCWRYQFSRWCDLHDLGWRSKTRNIAGWKGMLSSEKAEDNVNASPEEGHSNETVEKIQEWGQQDAGWDQDHGEHGKQGISSSESLKRIQDLKYWCGRQLHYHTALHGLVRGHPQYEKSTISES